MNFVSPALAGEHVPVRLCHEDAPVCATSTSLVANCYWSRVGYAGGHSAIGTSSNGRYMIPQRVTRAWHL
jgi:hypothetical protein